MPIDRIRPGTGGSQRHGQRGERPVKSVAASSREENSIAVNRRPGVLQEDKIVGEKKEVRGSPETARDNRRDRQNSQHIQSIERAPLSLAGPSGFRAQQHQQ